MTTNISAVYGPVSGPIGIQHNHFGGPSTDELVAFYYRQTATECEGLTLAAVNPVGESRERAFADDTYVPPEVWVIDEGKADKKSANLEREQRRVPLHDCLNSDDIAMRCLVLTAPSGFGKSTAVNVRVGAIAQGATPWLMLRFPSLRQQSLAQDDGLNTGPVERALQKDIRDKLACDKAQSYRVARAIIDRLDASPGVILFDALDEVPQGERDDVVACVRTFLKERERKQPTHRVLITSRPYAYTGQFAKDNFRRIELAEFTSTQQDELIGKWFAQSDKSPATGHALVAQISAARSGVSVDQTALARLMTEPMLLTYACMLAHARAPADGVTDTAPLPPTRHDLFDGVVSLMLEKWDPKRNTSDVAKFQRLFQADGDRRSILRQCLEHGALQELQGLDRLLVRYQSETFVAPNGFAGSLTQEKLVHWLDDAMPDDLPVRARTVVKWLAQRSGLLHAATTADGLRYVLQAQLRDFLAAGGLQSMVQSANEFVRSAVALLARQSQWYRPMMSTVLARLRDDPQALVYAVEQVLSPPGREPEPDASIVISAKNQNTPDFVTLHFVIAWANAFGEAGPSCQRNTALEQALTKLRQRCLELVTAPAEDKPSIALRAEAADALGLIGDPRFDTARWHLPAIRMRPVEEEPIPGFVHIAAGEFVMGYKGAMDSPSRKVRIDSPFYIARYATTVAQFGHFVDAGGYDAPQFWDTDGLLWLNGEYDKRMRDDQRLQSLRGRPLTERRMPYSWTHQIASPSRPVVSVTWFEARAYARWLSAALQEELASASLATYDVLLPTDPQWERAARWTATAQGYGSYLWPWGDDAASADAHGNFGWSRVQLASVGLYEPTGPTLFDIAGNAREWMDNVYGACEGDRFDRVPRDYVWQRVSIRDSSNILSLRCGSSSDSSQDVSCSHRDGSYPDFCSSDTGFRVVLSLAQNET